MKLLRSTTTSPIASNSTNRPPLRDGFLLIPLMLACFALLPKAQGVSPEPDGVYPGGNTAEGGASALFSLTTGTNNTALGVQALFSNTAGFNNTGTGYSALFANILGLENTANGAFALCFNTGGNGNTATGFQALFNNIGSLNTAIGDGALFSNKDGTTNTATGFQALFSNTRGNGNTVTGFQALFNNIGNFNTAIGESALFSNTIGSFNIALGELAGFFLTGNDNIDIGNRGVAGESNTIRIGGDIGSGFGPQTRTFIAGINEAVVKGSAVLVSSDGQLGVRASSERFKTDIKPMENASEAILALKPVTFRYKKEIDPDKTPQFGLVAEQVEEVNPDLVVRDAKGEVFTVRYEAVNAMLLNEFLKEHRKVEKEEATIADLKSTVAEQQKQIKALASGLQKVSDQLELSKPAPQTVLNQ